MCYPIRKVLKCGWYWMVRHYRTLEEDTTLRRLTQVALVSVLILAVTSLATAQRAPEPVVRMGNFFEVGNDVFMHIIAASDIRYQTVENRDFEANVRDRTNSRFPGDTAAMRTDADAAMFQ